MLAVVVVESTECAPNRSIFEISYVGDGSFNFIDLLLLLCFDRLICSDDLIFRHEKETSGWRENLLGVSQRVGVDFLSTRSLSSK